MNKKCDGCGAILQYEFKDKIGYINKTKYDECSMCERCFKIKNYGASSCIVKKNDFNKIARNIKNQDGFVVFLIDILNIHSEIIQYLDMFDNKLILITKTDLLPRSVRDKKLIEYFKNYIYKCDNIMCISSNKRKNIDEFTKQIRLNKIKKIYLVGETNSGKSSFLNALSSSLGKITNIVVSSLTNTTIDFIEIKFNDFTVYDTPGFVTKASIFNYLKQNEIKKILPNKELKVKTFQMKEGYSIVVDNYLRIDYIEGDNNSFSFYVNNNLKYMKVRCDNNLLKPLPKKAIDIKGNEDVVISGLGFIKIAGPGKVVVYTLDENLINVRHKLI